MPRKLSSWGTIVAGAYIAFLILAFTYAKKCTEAFCEVGAWIAVLPWFPVFEDTFFFNWGWGLILSLAFLNTLIIYPIFALLQRWVTRRRT